MDDVDDPAANAGPTSILTTGKTADPQVSGLQDRACVTATEMERDVWEHAQT